ncbi:MAG TPA: S1/P1 nuclease [Dokdonella sp.]|uniref:S1/P1 nuclease n=1 Tax=Dokdonella sp. TaxID=2291710 RepID=UPI002D806778|nr:S1/P1 nuclease [Dokdonella sp.]HET9032254.1 S1/P1 nuclease [Dokdonella sp.]
MNGRSRRTLRVSSFALLFIFMLPSIASAWGPAGHRMVAALAEKQLDAKTHSEIQHLLGILGASSLADIANWADEMRADPAQRELSRATSRLHYVNFSDSRCHYVAAQICPNGQCVVAAINHYANVLGDSAATDVARAEALRFLVHFVGDAHQPLHAGYRPDRGGNNYQVRFKGKGSNLHAIWDSKIIASRHLRWQDYARRLERPPVAGGDEENPVVWAEQSCRITGNEGFYPRGRTIDKTYLDRMRPLAEQQIVLAGQRLAGILQRSLSPMRPANAHSSRGQNSVPWLHSSAIDEGALDDVVTRSADAWRYFEAAAVE